MPTPESSDARRIEATASFQHDIDTTIARQYPDVSNDLVGVEQYGKNELHFVSFRPNSPFRDFIVAHALRMAMVRENEVTFAEHGARGHKVFFDAVEALLDAVRHGSATYRTQLVSTEVDIRGQKVPVKATRLLLESPPFERETSMPAPYVHAGPLRGNVTKELRRLAREGGTAFAVLVAMYRGLPVEDQMKIFDNQDFNNTLPKDQPRILRNHPYDEYWLKQLYDLLVTPVVSGERILPFSSDAYFKALNFLQDIGWLKSEQRQNEPYFDMVRKMLPTFARAVFLGTEEVAQQAASPNYTDPARGDYIDRKYGGLFTTRILTAFLVFEEKTKRKKNS